MRKQSAAFLNLRETLCGTWISPLELFDGPGASEGGRGLPQSKTLARFTGSKREHAWRILTLLAALALAWPATAADRRWTGSAFNDTWSEENNWAPSGPPQDGDTLTFGNNASHKSNRNDLSNLRVQSIVFDGTSGGYTLRGNPILLNADITAANSSGFNSVRFGVEFINGGGSFNSVRGGRLEVTGAVTLANQQTLTVFTFGTNITVSGAIVGDGGLEKLGGHALFLSGTAANTYTGSTTIKGGKVYLAKTSGARAISSRVTIGVDEQFPCDLADLEGGQYPPAMSVHIAPYSIWALTNGATVNNLTLDNGYIRGQGLLNLLCNVTNYGYGEIDCSLYLGDQTRTFFVERDGDFARHLEIGGHILGPSGGANPPGIVKEGSGFLMLKNQNTYSGPLLINDGIVTAEHPQALGTATGETRVAPWGILDVGRSFSTTLMTFSEPIVLEGGHLAGISPVTLNGPFTLAADSTLSGPWDARLDIASSITGPGGVKVRGGLVRFSGPAANTFTGPVVVEPAFLPPEAVLELAKPNYVVAVPTTVTLQGFRTKLAILRQFQDDGARDISIKDGGVWHLNGYAANPSLLKFLGGGTVDTGYTGLTGILGFSGLTVNTQLQVLPKLTAPSNYTARILGRINSFASTNDLFIPPGVTLDISAQVLAPVLQKRGPGKLVLGGDNRLVGQILARAGEVVSTADRALGGHTTVSDGATLWLASTFNFGSLTLQGQGFQGQGALATETLALFSSNIVLSASATIQTPTTNAILGIIGSISGTGSLSKHGVGLLILGGNTPNTFSGDMLVNAGTLELGKDDFIPAVPDDIVIGSGPPLDLPARVLYSRHDQVWNRITVNRGSLLDLNGRDEYSGDVTLNDGGDIQTGAGTLWLWEGVNLFVNARSNNDPSTISGHIGLGRGPHRFHVGSGSDMPGLNLGVSATIVENFFPADIVKEGAGSMSLTAANYFTGTFTANDGNVIALHSSALGTSAGGTILNGNASLSLGGALWVREEPLTLNSANPLALASLGGSNTWSGNVTLQRTAGMHVWAGVLNLMGLFDCCGGIISGPGGLTKTGPGALLITGFGPNSYAGPTLVNEGVLEDWRILSPALPGDVVVTGNNSSLRTGRSPANTALSPSASVTVKADAEWVMNHLNAETVREVSGNGRLNLAESFGSSATLTVANTNFCEFSGPLRGFGAIEKRGPAMFLLSGNSPFYAGTVTVHEGALRVDGRLHGAPVTVKSSAQLRGDGAVGRVIAAEPDSLVRLDASFADHPERLGGDLETAGLTVASGGIAAFDIFGPSPTAGNDLLISASTVRLDNARLSAEFSYPPRERDVVTLLRNDSSGAIIGSFSGWPEGITRKLGDVTVRATYRGGDGNDFTLTVTNLPVRPFDYRLAEGNGNQTVEPDECNLIFPLVANLTTNALTITNAHLRSLTPGAVVTIASATYPVIPRGVALESATPLQFRTERSLSCGQPVEFELILGVKNEGVFAVRYEVVAGEGPDCNHPTGGCESCFVVSGRFTTNAPTLLRAHTFVGAPSSCFPPKRCPEFDASTNTVPVPYLTHRFTNSTTNELCVTAQLKFACPNAPTNALGAVAYLGTNDYHGPCVNYLGDTGADGTQPFSFRVPPRTNFMVLVSARATNVVCPSYTLELLGLPCPPPTLRIANDAAPGKVLLQWSTASPGFTLQSTDPLHGSGSNMFADLPDSPFITGGKFTVTNSAESPKQFFRLAR